MNYKDVALMDQSFGNLQDSILRSRMLEQQKQERAQDRGFRERELSDREQQQAYERDPNNPENKIRNAQASIYQDQVKKLGITEMDTSWTTADGREVKLKGTAEQIKKAMTDAPPRPQTKITSKFTTKDGVFHQMEGTPEQLKAQQAALAEGGGGIEDTSTDIQEHRDSDGNQLLIIRNPKTGNIHTIRAPTAWETETTEYDDAGRPKRQIRRPVKPSAPATSASSGGQRVLVQKGDKKFTVPQAQLQQAIDQGYKRVD